MSAISLVNYFPLYCRCSAVHWLAGVVSWFIKDNKLSCKEIMGLGGSLVASWPFVQRVLGVTPTLATTLGPWASPALSCCLWCFGVKLRHSTRAVWGVLLSNSGVEEAL